MITTQTGTATAQPPLNQLRKTVRHPFVQPINAKLPNATHTVLTHDISRGGVGFYSRESLAGNEVTVALPTVLGRTISVRAQVMWAQPCSGGWYVNGARFLNLSNTEWAELRIATAASGFKRRHEAREPMFVPVRVQFTSILQAIQAYSRDLSPVGIGLFHVRPPVENSATISFERGGIETAFRAELAWSKQIDLDFHMSGWRFCPTRLMLEDF